MVGLLCVIIEECLLAGHRVYALLIDGVEEIKLIRHNYSRQLGLDSYGLKEPCRRTILIVLPGRKKSPIQGHVPYFLSDGSLSVWPRVFGGFLAGSIDDRQARPSG